MNKSCPVCGNKDMINDYYYDSYIFCEEHRYCCRCLYYYDFEYGNYREKYGNIEIKYSYSTLNDINKLCRLEKKIKCAKIIAHRNWIKHRKKFKRNKMIEWCDNNESNEEIVEYNF